MYIKSFPFLEILILLMSSFVYPLIKKPKNIFVISIASLLASFVLGIFSFIDRLENKIAYKFLVGHFAAPLGIELKIGILESMLGMIFLGVSLVVVLYSVSKIRKEIDEFKLKFFYMLINILVASILGMVYTNDIFNSFVFLEVSALASCGIIIVKDKKENIKATIRYLVLSCLGSGLILMGIAFLYSITGNLNFDFIRNELLLVWQDYRKITMLSLGLFTIGLGVKGAMFPLHIWLPGAHSSAPATSSALLSAIVIKGPVVLLIKIYYEIYTIEIIRNSKLLEILLLLEIGGLILGSFGAILQKEMKKVIAYSSVAQMGYIFFALGFGVKGIVFAIYHIIGHCVTKSALFMISGVLIEKKGKYLEDLKGIGVEMPKTMGLFFLASLSMIGIPMFPGFISKWNLSLLSISEGKSYLIIMILISSLLNLAYYFPVVINGFFGEDNIKGKIQGSLENKISDWIWSAVLMFGMMLIGIMSNRIISILNVAAEVFISK